MRVPAKLFARAVAPLLIALTVATCDLATAPGTAGTIALSFGPESTIVLGASLSPAVRVTLDGKTVDRPRVRFLSSDSASVGVSADGLALIAKRRDTVTVWAELESSLSSSSPPRTEQRFRVIVDSVALDRKGDTLTSLGETTEFTAAVFDANGDAITANDLRWLSSDATIAEVTTQGVVTAKKAGEATISAIVDADTARAAIKVVQVLDHFTFSRSSIPLDALGATASISASGVDARGSVIAGAAATWFSGNVSIATVTAGGVVTAVDNGSTFVRAINGAVEDTVAVVVNQAATSVTITGTSAIAIRSLGDEARLSALALDAGNSPVIDASPAWSSTAPLVAGVNSITGVVTALSAGSALIIARLDGVADTVAVTVTNEASRVDAQPAAITLTSVKDTLQPAIVVRNSLDDAIAGAAVTLRSTDPAVLLVLDNSRARAEAAGSAMLIAQSGAVADTIQVTVINVPVVIDIVPVSATMASIADSLRPVTTVLNARGANAGASSLIWSSEDPSVARVTLDGMIVARDTGQVTIRVASVLDATKKDSIFVTVTNAPASVNTDGSLDTLTSLGQSLLFTDTVRNARGARISNYPTSWSSNNTNAVTVTSSGLATAVGFGTARVIATAGAVADTLLLVVFDATKLYVDNSVVVTTGRFGTLKRPFDRVQDAVTTADAGDTVFIRRGNRPYAEMPSLNRRLTLLGDSTAFLSNGRNPAFLPLIAHDTGVAGIRAQTTAPQVIRYLAIKHTLDGAAIDADGSDATIEWVYINQPVVGSARIGRGISLRNSPSGSSVRNVRVRNVRGYGVRLENVSGAAVFGDSISGIDSIAGSQPGTGVYVVGGGNASIQNNVVRAAQGPQISVLGATSPVVTQNNLASQNTLIRYDNVQGSPRISFNTLDLRFQPGDDGQSSAQDNRAGIQLLNSAPPPRLFISSNTFIGRTVGSGQRWGPMDGVYVANSSEWFIESNTFIATRYTIFMKDASGFIMRNKADSAASFIIMTGADNPIMDDDTLRTMQNCIQSYTGGPHSVAVRTSLLQDCSTGYSPVVDVTSTNSSLYIADSRIDVRLRETRAVRFSGNSLTIDRTDIVVTDSTKAGDTVPDTTEGAVDATSVFGTALTDVKIAGFGRHAGLRVRGGTLQLERTTITRNRSGLTVGSPVSMAPAASNEVFDNRNAGLFHTGGLSSFPSGFWWGDLRGPRGTTATATGDSVGGTAIAVPSASAPFRTGTTPAAVMHVRGSGQSAVRSTVAPKALTVRVIDAQGRPVSGVSVTFTRTSASGGFPIAATITATTNSDGLAEATYTLGAAAGTNTITVAGTSVSIGTVTFTLTGT